jgi:hypothetical protein
MTPLNPFAATNESLVVNCTLLDCPSCSVDSLYFQWGDWTLPKNYTVKLDSRTKQLVLPNPPLHFSGVHLYCHGESNRFLAHQAVTIGGKFTNNPLGGVAALTMGEG